MHTLIQKATDLATLRSVVHRSSLSHRNHNSKSRIHSSTNIQEADDLIRQSPGSAKGYILMGKLYQQQNKWRAASAVYSAGLRLVNQKTNDDYAQLKREKQYVMGIIAKKHNQQSPPLFPYDILNIIFHSLSTSSLLQCATVCESWFYAIVEWPGFWHRLLNNDDSNQYHSSSSELRIIKYQEQDIQSLLTILLHSECHLVKSIRFEEVTLQKSIIPLLASVIRAISPPMTRLSFKNVDLSQDLLNLVFDACTNVTHFSYEDSTNSTKLALYPDEINNNNNNNNDNDIEDGDEQETPPRKIFKPSFNNMIMKRRKQQHQPLQQRRRNSSLLGKKASNGTTTTFQMMTTLQFSGISNTTLLIEAVQKCPNLESLYLDSHDRIHHGKIILHLASHYYPVNSNKRERHHFRFCCISKGAQTHHTRATTTTGFIIQDGHVNAQPSDISRYMKKLHPTSLELLSIDFDLRLITPRLFLDRNISHLRQLELCCASLYRNTMIPTKNDPSFETSFCALLSRCPGLQVLVIQDPWAVVPPHDNRLLERYHINITDRILVVLATTCTQLKQLTIEGTYHRYTVTGFDQYVRSSGSDQLEYLKINLDPDNHDIPEIINMLPRLVTLYSNNLGFQTRFAVEALLRQRDGSLLEDRYYPW